MPIVSTRARRLAAAIAGVVVLAACGESGGSGQGIPDGVDAIVTNSGDEPFASNGGSVSSSADVIVDPAGRDGLGGRIASATSQWPTDWTRRTIELDELQLGLPRNDPRDGIPPIDDPIFQPIDTATWLGERSPGALVQFNGETRFYPLSILTRHEIVNDRYGDIPVAVTFCPLCNSVVAFDARVDGNSLRFGVSGLLRNSDLVMWDNATTSLWQQITGEGVVGDFAGTKLELIPTSIVSFADARDNFPDALSLSTDTGFRIEYGRNSYVGYSSSNRPFLYDGEFDDRYAPLSRVVGVTVDGVSKAYPFEVISAEPAVNDRVNGDPIVVFWGGNTADALDGASIPDSEAIGSGIAYSRVLDGRELTFSANAGGTFTDTETETTWSLLGLATDGPLAGSQLKTAVHRNEFWFAWTAFFGDAEVYTG